MREYIAEVVGLLRKELERGNLRRVSVVIKSAVNGTAQERFLIDVGYGDLTTLSAGGSKDVG